MHCYFQNVEEAVPDFITLARYLPLSVPTYVHNIHFISFGAQVTFFSFLVSVTDSHFQNAFFLLS
jgi:hypothetical protein